VEVRRGQLVWSKLSLAKRWRWNERTVTKYLQMLERREMIHTKTTKLTTLITIRNYDLYQCDTEQNTGQFTDKSTGQSKNRIQTNKNEKNDENVKKGKRRSMSGGKGTTPEFESFWSVWPKKIAKQEALKAWRALNPSPELVDTILADIDKRTGSEDWQKEGGKYIPYPATYIRGRRWEDQGTEDMAARKDSYERARQLRGSIRFIKSEMEALSISNRKFGISNDEDSRYQVLSAELSNKETELANLGHLQDGRIMSGVNPYQNRGEAGYKVSTEKNEICGGASDEPR
jgi:hypothetical protein